MYIQHDVFTRRFPVVYCFVLFYCFLLFSSLLPPLETFLLCARAFVRGRRLTTRYFMLPHYGNEGVDATGYQSPASVSQTLPIRLVDYFVSASPGFVSYRIYRYDTTFSNLDTTLFLGCLRLRTDGVWLVGTDTYEGTTPQES